MIRITDKSLCCGCTACVSSCPVQCIVMQRDEEGFDYPVANPDICLECGKCDSVCPMKKSVADVPQQTDAYAVRCREFVAESSSGGVFPALAREALSDRGVVFGAVFEQNFKVAHCEAENMETVERMRGSKYVQSDLYSSFEQVRDYLADGRKVLFSGTPCQIAGLHSFLEAENDGLLTVDCACHGVPSPGLWERYLAAICMRENKAVKNVKFRDKSRSWRHYDVVFEFENQGTGIRLTHARDKDPYITLFLQNMTLRPSCYSCPFRNGRSGSDITLADLWNVHYAAPVLNDDKGASAVLVNTDKGREFFDKVCRSLNPSGFVARIERSAAVASNGGFAGTPEIPVQRKEFFSGYKAESVELIKYMHSFIVRKPFRKRVTAEIKRLFVGFKKMLK